jgi:1,3-beta-glucanosyltransferase GAS1
MDSFHTFPNTAGFFVGNEVLTMGNGSIAAPYVKAAARDLRAYRDAQKYRKIPVGYSAADIASLRPMLQNYLACGSDANATIEYFALNAYEWCGESSFAQSGYSQLIDNVKTYDIPIFFSETGCNTVPPRTFGDQAAIFGPDMTPYWSGAIIYEWIQETNNYGLVTYGPHVDPSSPGAPPDGWPRSGTPTPVVPDFNNLKSQWQSAIPSGVKAAAYSPSLSAPACPNATPEIWEVDASKPLPVIGGSADPSSSSSGTSSTSPTAKSGSSTRSSISSRTSTAVTTTATASAVFVATGFRVRAMMMVMICGLMIVGQTLFT